MYLLLRTIIRFENKIEEVEGSTHFMGVILHAGTVPIGLVKNESSKYASQDGIVYHEITGTLRAKHIRLLQKELGFKFLDILKNKGNLDTVVILADERYHVSVRGGWEGIKRPRVDAYKIPAQVLQA